jgi:hypothetical protein
MAIHRVDTPSDIDSAHIREKPLLMSDALTDITENRLDTSPGEAAALIAARHRGTVAEDDLEGRREPAGHGRHRRVITD